MIGECIELSFYSPASEQRDHNAIQRTPKPQQLAKKIDFLDQKYHGHTLQHAFSPRIQL
jgi:hypothetical protein